MPREYPSARLYRACTLTGVPPFAALATMPRRTSPLVWFAGRRNPRLAVVPVRVLAAAAAVPIVARRLLTYYLLGLIVPCVSFPPHSFPRLTCELAAPLAARSRMLPGMAEYVPPSDAPAWHAHYSMLRTPRPRKLSSLRTTLDQKAVSAISDQSGNLRPAAQAFVDAVQETTSIRSACSAAGLKRIERIADILDNATKEHSRSYTDPGMWGVFARGAQRNYEGAKVRFLHEQLCTRGTNEVALRKMQQPTVCEVGFCAGLSAMLFMESLPRARYVGWDLGDIRWTESNIELMRRAYGERFLGVALGFAASTIPLYQQAHPELKCDGARALSHSLIFFSLERTKSLGAMR